jgi:hypothetical protein
MFEECNLRKATEFKRIGSILIFAFIIIIINTIPGSANDYKRPEYTDGLENKWHSGSLCIPCHYTLLGDEKAKAISTACTKTCHARSNWPEEGGGGWKIDISNISNIHKDILCIRCHVGTKIEANLTAVDFHRVMSKTGCMECHTVENGNYRKPEKTLCSECHAADPHVVHGDRLERMCVACHGSTFAQSYINKSIKLTGNIQLPSVLNESSKLNESQNVAEYPTIGQLMTRIIEMLIRIIR